MTGERLTLYEEVPQVRTLPETSKPTQLTSATYWATPELTRQLHDEVLTELLLAADPPMVEHAHVRVHTSNRPARWSATIQEKEHVEQLKEV